jgi:glutathione peroxidase
MIRIPNTNPRTWLGLWALLALGLTAASPAFAKAPCPAVLQHTLPRLQDERPVDLCEYAGRVVVVVNTASECGYTPQYRSLEALDERYRARGLVVLGFPSNDFGGQEPGSNAKIAEFCENQFAVKFPMFAKSTVLPPRAGGGNPLYVALVARTGEAPKWNFHKYLIGRNGERVLSVASAVDPQDPAFIKEIERLLDSK